MGSIGCPETSVTTNEHSVDIREERRSVLHRNVVVWGALMATGKIQCSVLR